MSVRRVRANSTGRMLASGPGSWNTQATVSRAAASSNSTSPQATIRLRPLGLPVAGPKR
ncbi:MAG: hypothetical protein R3F62_24350 [Planctomycetota bacterium]